MWLQPADLSFLIGDSLLGCCVLYETSIGEEHQTTRRDGRPSDAREHFG